MSGAPSPRRLIWTTAATIVLLLVAIVALRLQRPLQRLRIVPQSTGHRVDINSADAATLAVLPGVGPGLAQRIVAYREANGPFASVEELTNVKLIGERTVERVRPWVVCGREIKPGDPADR